MTGLCTNLTPLEIASGVVLGVEAPERSERSDDRNETAREALDGTVLRGLLRPPCIVSFSGGRDSSAVLAAATDVARRQGVALPIPATIVPRAPAAAETDWQQQVVRHLGLSEWIRIDVSDELDAIGPYALRTLRRHGLLWPFNVHFHAPLLSLAVGGSLLTGIGGDELFGTTPTRVSMLLAGRLRPSLRDAPRIAIALGPNLVRRRFYASRLPMSFPWLREEARRDLARAWGRQAAAEPRAWREQVRWVRRLRSFRIGLSSLEQVARDDDVRVIHPFATTRVAAALAASGDKLGPTTRAQAMALVDPQLLPRRVLERPSKAVFDEVFWNTHSRAFAARWDGNGVDETLVDVETLRELWHSPAPPGQTFTLLQSAWLSTAEDGRGHR